MNAPAIVPADGSAAMFDGIARRYDLLNRLMSLGLDQRWRRRLVRAVAGEGPCRVLDVATGTGDVALAIARCNPAARVVGLDPCVGMLEVGRAKVRSAGLEGQIGLIVGAGQELPFPDNAFDGCAIAFGIRNVPDRDAGLREMRRVVRPGGLVGVLEVAEPRGGVLGAMARVHMRHVVPWLGARLSGAEAYRYLRTSAARFPPADTFANLMREAGFEAVRVQSLGLGAVHLYLGASRP